MLPKVSVIHRRKKTGRPTILNILAICSHGARTPFYFLFQLFQTADPKQLYATTHMMSKINAQQLIYAAHQRKTSRYAFYTGIYQANHSNNDVATSHVA